MSCVLQAANHVVEFVKPSGCLVVWFVSAWVIETGKGHTLRPHTYIHPNPTQDDIVHSVGGAQTVFNSTLRQHTLVYVEELPVVDEELTVGVDAPTWTTQSLLR